MRIPRTLLLSVVLVALLALLGGCGVFSVSVDSGTPTPGSKTPLVMAQPTTAATAVAGSSIGEPAPSPTETEGATTVTDTAITPVPAGPATASTPSTAANNLSLSVGSVPYLDDRSAAASLIQSYFNAINLKEYVRAYSYWDPGASQLKPYSEFAAGYAQTSTVQVTLGQIGEDAGAGNFYNTVPVALSVGLADGSRQTFVGCYVTHLGSPDAQQTAPFRPLGIRSASVQQVAAGTNTDALLAKACDAPGIPATSPVPSSPTPNPSDISSRRYLDDRSDPVQVIRSYYNAINLHQYLRAYSYWDPAAAAAKLKPFSQFEQGYESTQSVQLATGQLKSNAGAGQIDYQLPVALVSQTTGGTQTFVGCYTLHISRPEIQNVPPFQPLAITAATIKQVENNADTAQLMTGACQ